MYSLPCLEHDLFQGSSDLIYVGRFLQAHVNDRFGNRVGSVVLRAFPQLTIPQRDVRVYQQYQGIARKGPLPAQPRDWQVPEAYQQA